MHKLRLDEGSRRMKNNDNGYSAVGIGLGIFYAVSFLSGCYALGGMIHSAVKESKTFRAVYNKI